MAVRSAAVAQCYFPGGDGDLRDGVFTTCDLASLADGEVKLLGRLGTHIDWAGRKLMLGEVERVLLEMPGVVDAAVRGERNEKGEELRPRPL